MKKVKTKHGGKRKGAGRKPEDLIKDKAVIVRVDPNEHRAVKSAAKAEKLSISDFLRALIFNQR